ncbi:PREDICTED: uncharacterized protein LOC107194546 [Dufourea novaeangliae]|uniref:Uncharacterized protein n=1 Tax=Dufourea novaeangliae TaxID=178035 RepID=A0A154P312_DUFNO|nr:PREDICTED: uncharacterized protein LOC107194546 [Dufourea novaeangliae]KZC06306.1 hypothetical protein WN55_10215 [Dufourea novaeangliae]
MLSINMGIFKTVLFLVALVSYRVQCLSVANESSIANPATSKPLELSAEVDHYDQRQNGSENYRVGLDGLVVVFAPAEVLLLANAAAANKPILPILPESKPTVSKPEAEDPPTPAPKSTNRGGSRLTDLLIPFLRRFQHQE